nr:integrase, catalytic region, zinc finger, CCHC-type, peptidase aspartic, catalytic [Tanacetum cinerariifolium]
VSTNAPLPSSSPFHSFDLQQIAASLEDKLDIRMNRFEKSLYDMKAFVPPTAPTKAVEEQHETHANENKMMLERFSQPTVYPLALLSNVSNPQHYSPLPSASSSTQVPPPLVDSSSPAEDLIENLTNTLALLTQSYRTFLPQTNNQLRASSNARNQATVQDDRVDDDCDAFDSDVDEAPTAQTMSMANLSSADPVTDEAGPSYDSELLYEVPDYEHCQDAACAHHEGHVTYDSVQLDHVVDSHADITSDSNMILYDQYVKDNEEETLKRELHSIKLQLASTINHNKSMVEEVSFLKMDFKQKENKYLEDFLDMKSLKEKVKDKLIKQDQSLQIVHMLCRPKPHYNELNKVAIGYKNLLCLTRAKQVQPALYNGHEIIKDNHAPAIVHNTEDTLEIAGITRKKMNAKINDPECMTRKVKIAPHDNSKENFLATFTPQKQLTPEQIFWSNDLMKLKSEALKERTKVSRPIKALTVYPPYTPAMLVPKVLPTKSQVKIHIFTLIQLFLEFDKTCKKRITPTGLIDGERGFEQTKECYLKEVVPFLKTLKDNFEGIQKALTKEIKEMKNVFEELEAETIDSQITKLTDQVTHLQAQNDLFRAENDKIKQHYNKDHVKPQVLAREKHAIDVKPIVPRLRNNKDEHLDYLRHLKESVETIRDIVEEAKVVRPLNRSIVFTCRYSKHSHELLEYAIGTCPQGSHQRAKQLAYIPLTRKKQVIVAKPSDKSDRVNSFPNASGSQPKSHVKPNRILLAKGIKKLPVEDQPRTNKSHLRTSNRVDSSSFLKRTVVQIVLWYLDSGCSKHMTRDRSRLMNFVKKFTGTVRFRNDHFRAIMGYGDYVIGDNVISSVYYVEGLGHNLFSVRQFYDFDLEVAFRKHSFYVRDTDGVELIKGSRGSNITPRVFGSLTSSINSQCTFCIYAFTLNRKSQAKSRKVNVVADALSRKEQEPLRVRALRNIKKEDVGGTYGMATDYGIMKEEMSKLNGRKSVPGMNSRKKGKMERKTTRSSRELHGKELV